MTLIAGIADRWTLLQIRRSTLTSLAAVLMPLLMLTPLKRRVRSVRPTLGGVRGLSRVCRWHDLRRHLRSIDGVYEMRGGFDFTHREAAWRSTGVTVA